MTTLSGALIQKKVPTCSIRKSRIIQQALAMLTIEEVKNDIAILDNQSFIIENNDEEELRSHLGKLVKQYRKNMQN